MLRGKNDLETYPYLTDTRYMKIHGKMDAQVRNRLEAKRNGLAVELNAAFPFSVVS